MEELIEQQRTKLGTNLTKITLETFREWKSAKLKEKKELLERETKKKKDAFKTGRIVGKISGREVFQFRPELVADDDEEESFDMAQYTTEEDEAEDDTKVVDISIEAFNAVDYAQNAATLPSQRTTEPVLNMDSNGLEEACAVSFDDNEQSSFIPTIDGVPVEESLFEDLGDLDLDDEMVE